MQCHRVPKVKTEKEAGGSQLQQVWETNEVRTKFQNPIITTNASNTSNESKQAILELESHDYSRSTGLK